MTAEPKTSKAKKSKPPAWANKIVEYGEADPKTLIEHPANFKIHTAFQSAVISGSLRELGWIQDITVSKRSGRILDGHLRVALALKEKQPTVPVKYVDLDEAQEHEAILLIDPTAALAEIDKDLLDRCLRETQSGETAIQQFLADLAEQNGNDYSPDKGEDPPEDFPEHGEQELGNRCPKCGYEF